MTNTASRFVSVTAKALLVVFALTSLSACAGSSSEVDTWWYNQRWESAGGSSEGV